MRSITSDKRPLAGFLKIVSGIIHAATRLHIGQVLIAVMLALAISLPSAPAFAATSNLTVNGAQTYQYIDGMGLNINVNSWNNGQVKPALDTLINTNGCSIFRVIRDPIDWVSSESLITALHNRDVVTLQQVYETPKMQDIWNTIGYLNQKGIQGNQIILNFMGWTPTWLGGSGAYGRYSTITPGKESSFATMIVSLVYYGRKVKNLDFKLLAPTNEPDLSDGIEGPYLSANQNRTVYAAIVSELNSMELTDIRLVGPDTLTDQTSNYISLMMGNSSIASRIDHIGVHEYWVSRALPPAYPPRNYWLTETGGYFPEGDNGGTPPNGEWYFACENVDIILADIGIGWSAVLYWDGYSSTYYHENSLSGWGLLAYNPSTGVYTPRQRFYPNTHVNRFIRPGMVRVGVSGTSSSISNTVATYNQTTGQLSIVGHNKATSSVTISGQLQNIPTAINSLALYITNQSINLQRQPDVTVSGGIFTVQIPADTFFSLTNVPISSDTAPPTVAIVSPPNGATISGTVTVTASSSDDVGVVGVRFLLDGASLGTEVSSSPYSISWDTMGTSDGGHTLSAIARDTSGNEAVSSIGVIVANGTVGSIFNVQKASSVTTGTSSLAASLPLKVTAGNLIVVSVSGWPTPATVTVTDSLGNNYIAAGAMQKGTDNIFCSLYYARNVSGGTDTVTVKASASGQLSMTAAEFTGVDPASPLGATSGASGTSATPSSGNMAPSMSGVLVIGAGTHNGNTVTTAGSGFTMIAVATEDADNHQPLATEYKVLGNTNPTAATFTLTASKDWVQVGALFKPAAPAIPDITPPSVPGGLTATAISTSQVNLSWNPSTDDVGVAGYRIFRNGTQIATTSAASYSDTGLQASTTYTYTVAAYDAAGNTSAQSSQVSVTTKAADTTPPSVPGGLTATAISTSQVNLSWNPSTDDVGVAGYRIFRNGTQIATTSATSYSNTGLQASTTYTYTVAAYDAAGNTSAQSSQVSITTKAADFSISVSPSSRTVYAGRSTTYTVKLTALNGYNLPVNLSISGLPSGATYAFSRNPLTPTASGASSTLTVYTSRGRTGTFTLTITGTGTDINITTHPATVTLKIR